MDGGQYVEIEHFGPDGSSFDVIGIDFGDRNEGNAIEDTNKYINCRLLPHFDLPDGGGTRIRLNC